MFKTFFLYKMSDFPIIENFICLGGQAYISQIWNSYVNTNIENKKWAFRY